MIFAVLCAFGTNEGASVVFEATDHAIALFHRTSWHLLFAAGVVERITQVSMVRMPPRT